MARKDAEVHAQCLTDIYEQTHTAYISSPIDSPYCLYARLDYLGHYRTTRLLQCIQQGSHGVYTKIYTIQAKIAIWHLKTV